MLCFITSFPNVFNALTLILISILSKILSVTNVGVSVHLFVVNVDCHDHVNRGDNRDDFDVGTWPRYGLEIVAGSCVVPCLALQYKLLASGLRLALLGEVTEPLKLPLGRELKLLEEMHRLATLT